MPNPAVVLRKSKPEAILRCSRLCTVFWKIVQNAQDSRAIRRTCDTMDRTFGLFHKGTLADS